MIQTKRLRSEIRLVFCSWVTMVMVLWVYFSGGLPPLILPPGMTLSPWPIIITAVLATLILITLIPVVFVGNGWKRWASIVMAIIPILILIWIVGRSFRILDRFSL